MGDSTLYDVLLVATFVAAPLVAIHALSNTAPYGRHNREKAGPQLPTRIGWVYMECPSVFAFLYFFSRGEHAAETVPLVLLALWQLHYVQRTLVYPFIMRVRTGDTIPLLIATSGFLYNCLNSYLNATWISSIATYPAGWLSDPRFVIGVALFGFGYWVNRDSDRILRNLRAPGESGYKIPHGGLYRFVSAPNYFGELLIWTGYAIAAWSLAGVSFAVWTAANLGPRAIANHRWYREQFADYPPERKAFIPFVV